MLAARWWLARSSPSAVESSPGGPPLLQHEDYVGLTLGEKYRVLRWIADGGMGSVFEAENTWTKRRVAVKVLAPEVSRVPERVTRFVREARSATRIEHPNIVDVLDMGEDKPTGTFFLVQELLRGRDLHHVLRDAPGHRLQPERTLSILVPIMEALEAAHLLGVIHRDVKPGNIYLAQVGALEVPKLIDFGLSKLVRPQPGERVPVTDGGVPLGTPHYMSPEQAHGIVELDGRSDLWSIGVVMYQCLTGRLPFDGPNPTAVMLKIATERPRAVDERADVPPELAAIVHRALDPDRDRRWASMTEMIHALRDMKRVNGGRSLLPPSHSGTMRAVRPVELGGSFSASEPPDLLRPMPAPVFIEQLPWQPAEYTPPPAPAPVPNRPLRTSRLRLGMYVAAPGAREASLELQKQIGRQWRIALAGSYAQLVDALAEGELDVAWLPPVAYVRAVRSGAARLMLTLERDGRRSYSAALVVREQDGPRTLQELAGRSVAWVDPWSAAGYLVPRCMLRAAGIEPDRTFAAQSFQGSYDNVMTSLLEGTSDVGAMLCRVGDNGEITSGAFRDDRRLRALAVGVEPVPGDTICVSAALSVEDAREVVEQFIRTAAAPGAGPLFREVLGSDRFVAANASRYEGLEAALLEDLAADR